MGFKAQLLEKPTKGKAACVPVGPRSDLARGVRTQSWLHHLMEEFWMNLKKKKKASNYEGQ